MYNIIQVYRYRVMTIFIKIEGGGEGVVKKRINHHSFFNLAASS